MDTIEKAKLWLNEAYDEETRTTVQNMINSNDPELFESFYKDLEFGTGGLRGIMGTGSNRMNKYTIGFATQGLSNYLLQTFPNETIKVAIAYDSRNNSKTFAAHVANIFKSNGFTVYLFNELRPTPELSFAIREYGCKSGVVLTASHNPKEYNGYKAYWTDGSQVLSPHDKNIIAEVQKITSPNQVKLNLPVGEIIAVGEELDKTYLGKVTNMINLSYKTDLKVVYTSLHGTGVTLVPDALKMAGIENVAVVEAQNTPDGNFPTVDSPNPEESAALKMAIDQAIATNADIVLGTDPDTDRVGIAVKNSKGNFELFNGNQTGVILADYILNNHKNNHGFNKGEYIAKTVVTTEMIPAIAANYGVDCFDTLTGFKYIAEVIRNNETQRNFLYGAEESYGYMIGDFVRDKDAVAGAVAICAAAADAKKEGLTLRDHLNNLYLQHGYYKEGLLAIVKKGSEGASQIKAMMDGFRNNPPKTLNNSKVVVLKDFEKQTITNLVTGAVEPTNQPVSNVLQYTTESGDVVTTRPSGTEPKIKFYFGVKVTVDASTDFENLDALSNKAFEQIKTDLGVN